MGSLQLVFWGFCFVFEFTVFRSWWFSSKQMRRSRGHSNLTSTNHLITLATFIGFVSRFGQHFFIPLFSRLVVMVSGTSHSDIKIEWVVSVCLVHFPSYPLPEGELWDVAHRLQGLPLGDSFNHVVESLLERARCEEALPLGLGYIKSCVHRAPVGAHCATRDSPSAPQNSLSPAQTSFFKSPSHCQD